MKGVATWGIYLNSRQNTNWDSEGRGGYRLLPLSRDIGLQAKEVIMRALGCMLSTLRLTLCSILLHESFSIAISNPLSLQYVILSTRV